MLRTSNLVLVSASLFLLAGCHSNAGYFSANPELSYGPGVVEFPDPLRVYVPGGGRSHRYSTAIVHRPPVPDDVIYLEEVSTRRPPPPRPPAYPHYEQPVYGDTPAVPVRRRRVIRRIPGQPLGIEFVD